MNIFDTIITLTTLFGIYGILAISMNLEYGYTGIPNFGKALFYGMGLFVFSVSLGRLFTRLLGLPDLDPMDPDIYRNYRLKVQPYLTEHWALSLALLVAAILLAVAVSAIVGYIASYPALRLKEDYLAIMLLAAAEAVRNIMQSNKAIMGGVDGYSTPDLLAGPAAKLAEATGYSQEQVKSILVLGIVMLGLLVSFLVAERLGNSPFGRAMKAVRDDEVAAESLGKDLAAIRARVLIIASGIAGLSGALMTVYLGKVNAENFKPETATFFIIAMMLLGGRANNAGVLLGALTLTGLDRATTVLSTYMQRYQLGFLSQGNALSYLNTLLWGLLIIIVLFFRPEGIIPEGRVKTPAWSLLGEEDRRKYLQRLSRFLEEVKKELVGGRSE